MRLVYLLFTLLGSFSAFSQQHPWPMQQRAEFIDEITEHRLKHVLPELMRRENIDMWIVIAREYNEDPIVETLLPATWLAARRRTILVMYTPAQGRSEYYAIARYQVGSMFEKAWDKETQPNQWQALVELIKQKQPKRIGLNISEGEGLADGLTHSEYLAASHYLNQIEGEIVSAESLAISWLETRSKPEITVYAEIVALGHSIIAEAFSNKVITPGKTTTDDVVWWLREKTRELKLVNWFHPTVSIQRADQQKFDHVEAFSQRPGEQVIQPGDLLHVDFGFTYLRLNTDQQQHAYVLRPGETDAPDYLKHALANGNQLQDIFTDLFKQGRSGNEILLKARSEATNKGLIPHIYTHPIGYHGHAAGTTLGMWDAQEGVPGAGDRPLHLNTAYSIELNAATSIPEWGKTIRIMLEENAIFTQTGVHYLDGRQQAFHLIKSQQ